MVDIPGVSHRPEGALDSCSPHAEPMHVCLSHDDCSSLFEPGDGRRVACRNAVLEMLKGRSGPDPGRIVEVFDCDWYPVEQAAVLSGLDFRSCQFGLSTRLIGQRSDERI